MLIVIQTDVQSLVMPLNVKDVPVLEKLLLKLVLVMDLELVLLVMPLVLHAQ